MSFNKTTFKVVQEHIFTQENLADLLCSALEGGSNYWYRIVKKKEPKEWTFDERPIYHTPEEAKKNEKFHYLHYYPFNYQGGLFIDDSMADDPELKKPVLLDAIAIQYGLNKWAEDATKPDEDETRTTHPNYWTSLLSGEDWDAELADVFLQYCIFGKVIYS